jgi:hypothetical protein
MTPPFICTPKANGCFSFGLLPEMWLGFPCLARIDLDGLHHLKRPLAILGGAAAAAATLMVGSPTARPLINM